MSKDLEDCYLLTQEALGCAIEEDQAEAASQKGTQLSVVPANWKKEISRYCTHKLLYMDQVAVYGQGK